MGQKNDSLIFTLFLEIAKAPPLLSIPMAILLWANYQFGWLIPTDPKSPFVPLMLMVSYVFVWMGAIAALISVGLELKRLFIFKNTQASSDLNTLNWKDFEIYCQQWLKNNGYIVENNWDKGPDGGIDIRAYKNGVNYLVQCKHWSKNIGVSSIRELYGIAQLEKAKAIFMTSSNYTHEALTFAKKSQIITLTGSDLIPSQSKPNIVTTPDTSCPKCGNQLTLRIAKKGPHTGKEFWGCQSFPKCRFTRDP